MGLFLDGEPTAFSGRRFELDPTGFNNLTTQFPLATQDVGLTRQLSIAPGTNFRLRARRDRVCRSVANHSGAVPVYYAYNIHRLHTQVIAPPIILNPSEISEQLVPMVADWDCCEDSAAGCLAQPG